ncbi:MAG: PH domain-containing protein [Oscillospiraceae bacterium]
MAEYKRFHFLYSIKYIKYALILCVVPMLRALIAFDLDSLFLALRQDAVILVLMLLLAALFWYYAGYKTGDECLYARSGLLCPVTTAIPYNSIAVLEITRPLLLRLCAASKLKIYFKNNFAMRSCSFYLPRKTAAALADRMLPVKTNHAIFAPAGANRLVFTMLSANIATSTFFIFTFIHRLDEVLGHSSADIAISRIEHLSKLIAPFLPAGLAFIMSILFLLFAFGLFLSFLHTAGFSVCRNNGILICRGGLITHTERRFRCSSISACDVRVTFIARLLRRYPIFIYCGSYTGNDAPAFAFSRRDTAQLSTLLPELVWQCPPYKAPRARSIMQYIWLALSSLLLFSALFIVACLQMPSVRIIIALPIILSCAALLVSIEGYGREGLTIMPNRTIAVCYTSFFTRHDLCILTQDVSLLLWQHPVSASEGRCDIYLYLPCHKKVRVRGVQAYYAKNLTLFS